MVMKELRGIVPSSDVRFFSLDGNNPFNDVINPRVIILMLDLRQIFIPSQIFLMKSINRDEALRCSLLLSTTLKMAEWKVLRSHLEFSLMLDNENLSQTWFWKFEI